jgi:hypothetical protein
MDTDQVLGNSMNLPRMALFVCLTPLWLFFILAHLNPFGPVTLFSEAERQEFGGAWMEAWRWAEGKRTHRELLGSENKVVRSALLILTAFGIVASGAIIFLLWISLNTRKP